MSQNAWLVDMGFVVQAATDGDRFNLDYIAARNLIESRLGRTDAYLKYARAAPARGWRRAGAARRYVRIRQLQPSSALRN